MMTYKTLKLLRSVKTKMFLKADRLPKYFTETQQQKSSLLDIIFICYQKKNMKNIKLV